MDPAYVKHVADNPNAGRAKPRGTTVVAQADVEARKSATVRQQERYLRASERERYENATKEARSLGKEIPPFVCSLDVVTDPGEEPEIEAGSIDPKLTPAQKAAATRAKNKKEKEEKKEESEGSDGDDDAGKAEAAEAFANLGKAQDGTDPK